MVNRIAVSYTHLDVYKRQTINSVTIERQTAVKPDERPSSSKQWLQTSSVINLKCKEKNKTNTDNVSITTIFPIIKEDLMEEAERYIDVKVIKSPELAIKIIRFW